MLKCSVLILGRREDDKKLILCRGQELRTEQLGGKSSEPCAGGESNCGYLSLTHRKGCFGMDSTDLSG